MAMILLLFTPKLQLLSTILHLRGKLLWLASKLRVSIQRLLLRLELRLILLLLILLLLL